MMQTVDEAGARTNMSVVWSCFATCEIGDIHPGCYIKIYIWHVLNVT